MQISDFKDLGIDFFSPKEITDTGATIESVQSELIVRLNGLRHIFGREIVIVPNGLTTGVHSCEYHPEGLAADITLNVLDGLVVPEMVFKHAVEAGFKGIGLYWGSSGEYYFHLDLRPAYAFWRAVKNSDNVWDYQPVDFDPKNLKAS